jgi:hypothetical protein
VVTELEDRLDLVLTIHYGRTLETVWTLYTDVIPRLPLPERLNMLERALEVTEAPRRPAHKRQLSFAEAAPLLLPLLRELIEARHALAHTIALPVTKDEATVHLRRRRRGRIEILTFEFARLEALAEQYWPLRATLDDLLPRVGRLEVWGELMGFRDK